MADEDDIRALLKVYESAADPVPPRRRAGARCHDVAPGTRTMRCGCCGTLEASDKGGAESDAHRAHMLDWVSLPHRTHVWLML